MAWFKLVSSGIQLGYSEITFHIQLDIRKLKALSRKIVNSVQFRSNVNQRMRMREGTMRGASNTAAASAQGAEFPAKVHKYADRGPFSRQLYGFCSRSRLETIDSIPFFCSCPLVWGCGMKLH